MYRGTATRLQSTERPSKLYALRHGVQQCTPPYYLHMRRAVVSVTRGPNSGSGSHQIITVLKTDFDRPLNVILLGVLLTAPYHFEFNTHLFCTFSNIKLGRVTFQALFLTL